MRLIGARPRERVNQTRASHASSTRTTIASPTLKNSSKSGVVATVAAVEAGVIPLGVGAGSAATEAFSTRFEASALPARVLRSETATPGEVEDWRTSAP